MTVQCGTSEPRISVRGEHVESVVAEFADLSFHLSNEMDTDTEASARLQHNLDNIISLMQRLSPGLPKAVSSSISSKPTVVTHPSPESSTIWEYSVASARISVGMPSKMVSKSSSSLMSSSKIRTRSSTSTVIVVTFGDFSALARFTLQILINPFVRLESITWRVKPSTARRVRRAARTGAVTETYERAWDLAYASLSTMGTEPPETPVSVPAANVAKFCLSLREMSDTSTAPAPVLRLCCPLRTTSKGPNGDGVTVDPDAFQPPELSLTVQVHAVYAIITSDQ